MGKNVRIKTDPDGPTGNLMFDASAGRIEGLSTENKFGQNTDLDTGVSEPIWSRGGAWVPPTEARVHNIVSTSADDTSAGTGARVVRVWGLTDWDSAQTSEDVVMSGTTPVATANSYVMINRMRTRVNGSGGVSVGTITATAQTDGTVTAEIVAGEGQTLQAIYGFPRGYKAFIADYYASVNRANSSAYNLRFRVEREPDVDFAPVTEHILGGNSTGTGHIRHNFTPMKKDSGSGDHPSDSNHYREQRGHIRRVRVTTPTRLT